ncbi:MAG: serine/threonine-protein phosphatase [Planctomycetota bacterium]|nr:MAG: serine/threonine-protein phosphatase [Planctomycetota bacterium]
MPGKIDCFGLTDIGCKREENQDQFLIAGLNKAMRVHQSSLSIDDNEMLLSESQGVLLLVADGMGGQAGGERASRLAVEGLATYLLDTMPWFFNLDTEGDEEARTALNEAIIRCQEKLSFDAKVHPDVHGMGTTITAAYVRWPRATIVHAGDSRCYLHHQGSLSQLTTDHTLAEQFSSTGAFRKVDLAETRWAHVLWNAVGSDMREVEPEVNQFELQMGDTLLLCTDGLMRHVEDPELTDALNTDHSSEKLCHELVDRAKSRGGRDNITVVVARFVDNDQAEAMTETQELDVGGDDSRKESPQHTPVSAAGSPGPTARLSSDKAAGPPILEFPPANS